MKKKKNYLAPANRWIDLESEDGILADSGPRNPNSEDIEIGGNTDHADVQKKNFWNRDGIWK